MKSKSYFSFSTLIFSVVAVVHLIRAINGAVVSVGSTTLPVWGSWVAVLVAGYMAYQGWNLRSKN